MVCPKCKKNSVSFFQAWTRSGFGKYRCSDCGAVSRVKKSRILMLGSFCLGILAAGSAVYFQSWKVLIVASVTAIILDAVMDFFFRRLELDEPKA